MKMSKLLLFEPGFNIMKPKYYNKHCLVMKVLYNYLNNVKLLNERNTTLSPKRNIKFENLCIFLELFFSTLYLFTVRSLNKI